jgi:predicted GNAT family acetyltransferase
MWCKYGGVFESRQKKFGMKNVLTFELTQQAVTKTITMLIQQQQDGDKGKFLIEENGTMVGELEYQVFENKKIQLIHTEVNEAFRGKKIGDSLVEHAVEFARANYYRVIPTCRFAKAFILRRSDLQDVLE